MALFEDGSYSCTPGIALIAKALAGQCQMNYTRAAVGKGTISEGQTPKTMTEPAEYVMDASISAVTNPVGGECQVTVQINSSDVETGFFATGILLYAEDPDEGEVPYTYLVLENGPEWIRPSSSAVGKLATFDLIAAVGEVDTVTATIDPDSIVTRDVVEQLIAGATVQRDMIIPAEGWNAGAPESGPEDRYIDISQSDVTEAMVPIINIYPEYGDVAKSCGMSATARTMAGGIRLYSKNPPAQEISANLVLLSAGTGRAVGGAGGDGEGGYILPTATRTRLGGVIIGENINTAGDGTISVNKEGVSDDISAGNDETNEMLDEVFGAT